MQIEEILDQGSLPSRTEIGTTYYYVDVEASSFQEQPYFLNVDGEEAPPKTSTPTWSKTFSEFLRCPQESPRKRNVREEPLVDYS